MLLRFLFGDDVFISYSRRDGAIYAATLANELSKPGAGLSCFLDQWGASAASELSPPVRRALRRSRVLVLVGTPGASASPMVREEVTYFSRRSSWTPHRPIIPINVDGGLETVTWTELTGLHRVAEGRDTGDGAPSPRVVRVILDSCTFTTRNQRVRMLSLAAAALLAASVGAGVYAVDRARAARDQEQIAQQNAEEARTQERLAQANLKVAQERQAEATAAAERADSERLRAEQQARLAVSRQLSASAALLVQQGNRLPDGVRTAIEALESQGNAPPIEAFQALRNGLALLPRQISRFPHARPVRFATLSRDGAVLATADEESVSVWDGRRGRLVASRRYAPRAPFTGLSLSPDGALLAVGYGGTLEVLQVPPVGGEHSGPVDLTTSAAQLAIRQPQRPTFSPDGRYLAASGYGGGSTRVWTVPEWKETSARGGAAVGFSPDGTYLFLVGTESIRTVTAGRDNDPGTTFPIPAATAAAFSYDGSHLATADETSVRVWHWVPQPRTWRAVSTITHQGRLTTLAISSDGTLVSVGAGDGTARVWDVAEQREVLRLTHGDAVTAVAFSQDSRAIVTAGEDRAAVLWEATPDVTTRRLPHGRDVRAVAFAPAGDRVWTIADDGRIRGWDMASRVASHMVEAGPAMSDGEVPYTLLAAAFDPGGQHAAAAISDGTVFVWNLASGSAAEFTVDGGVSALAVGSRGDLVAVMGEQLEVWATGETPTRRLQVTGTARALAFSVDQRRLAAALPGRIRVFDVVTGKPLRTLATDADTRAVAFSSGGSRLAFAGDGNRVSVWEWQHAETAVPVTTENGTVGALAFSADDRYLAYSVAGRIAVVRDLAAGAEPARLTYEGEVAALAFSRDARYLAMASPDGLARVSLWKPADLIAEARKRLSLHR